MNENDEIRLRHILDAAKDAISFIQGKSKVSLETDRLLTLGLVKSIEIIGEAAFHISEESRAATPVLQWPDMIGMRHRLIHAYYDINIDTLWQTVTEDLPPLIEALENIIRTEGLQ